MKYSRALKTFFPIIHSLYCVSLSSSRLPVSKYRAIESFEKSFDNILCGKFEDILLWWIGSKYAREPKSKPFWTFSSRRTNLGVCFNLSMRWNIKCVIFTLEEFLIYILTRLHASKYLNIRHKQPLCLYQTEQSKLIVSFNIFQPREGSLTLFDGKSSAQLLWKELNDN